MQSGVLCGAWDIWGNRVCAVESVVSEIVHDVVVGECGFWGHSMGYCGKRGSLHEVGVFGCSFCHSV